MTHANIDKTPPQKGANGLSARAILFVLTSVLTSFLWQPSQADALPTPARPSATASLPGAATAATDPDPLSVRRRFAQGLKDLHDNRLGDASAAFRLVADHARLAERRAAAMSLSRYAVRLRGLGVNDAPEDDPSAGRTTFIVTTTLASFYSGVVLLDILDNDSTRIGAAILLGTTGVGLTAAIKGSRNLRITEATADAYTIGVLNGFATGGLLSIATDVQSSESIQISMLVGVGIGGTAGFLLGDSFQPTRGQVNFIGTTSLMGLMSAGLCSVMLESASLSGKARSLIFLGGLQLGTIGGAFLAEDVDWSVSRSRLVFLGALVGGLAGGGLVTVVAGSDIDGEGIAGASLLGLWGGLGLAIFLTEDMTPDRSFRSSGTRSALVPTFMPNGGAGLAWAGQF